MRIVQHREIPEDNELRIRWNALAMQMERPEVFYTCEWALAMQTAYRQQRAPLLILGYDGNELAGIASLAINPKNNTIEFLSATTADYCDFLSAPATRPDFIHAVFAKLKENSNGRIALANLPNDSCTEDSLRSAAKLHGSYLFSRPAYTCTQVRLGTGEQRQELKNALLAKKKLRRYLRAMEREGPVTFAHLHSWKEIESALPEFANAHVARFAATGRTSSLATPERRIFLEDLARRFDGAGVVTLSQLRIQGRPVAWNFGFQFHKSWFWYQPTFDSLWEEHSPGYCLLARIVVEACDKEELELVDLGLGGEGYKERFGNSARQTLHITISDSRIRHLREVARYRAASAVKRSPKIESALRRALGITQ
ncbi:MAG TPA: GNAT family N-acetyltransferase [Candidatus Sulfotelmatobacter sp.]